MLSTMTSTSHSSVVSDEVRVIPFLRRLFEMLQENTGCLSFIPGKYDLKSQRISGKIVVHDRKRVEKEVLPRYFNHSSFASLRRQLNYFAFVRLGRGREKGATYYNESVIVLGDILRLKRVVPEVSPRVGGRHLNLPISTSSALRTPVSNCPDNVQLRHPLSICNTDDTASPYPTIAVPTKESVNMTIQPNQCRLSYDRRVITPVSPPESGDEEHFSDAFSLERCPRSVNSNTHFLAFQKNMCSGPLAENDAHTNVLHQVLQSEELLVCAALVNMGKA